VPAPITGRGRGEEVHGRCLEMGRGELLRAGTDVTLAAVGTMVEVALAAADWLKEQGVSAAVVDARFVKPLDESLLTAWAARTGRLVTVEEHVVQGGFGSAVLEALARADVKADVRLLGIPEMYVPHGRRHEWLECLGLTAARVGGAALELTRRQRAPLEVTAGTGNVYTAAGGEKG
ncbi:MAG TPA: 1-deoxy-D-xylulose-5-phosphate synthase, partial [Firmicutes bacterium]|nr:1-deoxy-D-xylulose-5-phosphate synthase [Bacillota bacterium]